MPFVALIIVALLGWALWTGRIRPAQLLPILLALGGAFIALRGQWVIGLLSLGAGVAWYRGMTWRLLGTRAKQTDEYALSAARWLLGVSAQDDADGIRARHRALISDNHPDRGGSDERARELNQARDLLLDDLARKSK